MRGASLRGGAFGGAGVVWVDEACPGRGSAALGRATLQHRPAEAAPEGRGSSSLGSAASPHLPIPGAEEGSRRLLRWAPGWAAGLWARAGGSGATACAEGGGLGPPSHGGPGAGAEARPGARAGAGGRERGRERHPGGEPVWPLAEAAGAGGHGCG